MNNKNTNTYDLTDFNKRLDKELQKIIKTPVRKLKKIKKIEVEVNRLRQNQNL